MKDIQPTTTQMKRLQAGKAGEGFLMYKMDDGRVEVVQLALDLTTGDLTKADGTPLIFWTDPTHAVGYQVIRLTGQGTLFA